MFGRKDFNPFQWTGFFMRDFEFTGSYLRVEAIFATAGWIVISQTDKSLS
jgi:hypothetical protein